MRALGFSAFVLTLLLSAVTVFFALKSDTLDGEPFATILIDPPKQAAVSSATQELRIVKAKVASPASRAEEPEVFSTAESIQRANASTSQPRVSPTTAAETSDQLPSDETIARQAVTVSSTRPTETARPISNEPDTADDPFFNSAEPGLGLGVGNLGPLVPESSSN